MAKNIVVVGFGPGNATAVAEKFGAEGFSVGIIGRNKDRLAAGVSDLKAKGVAASAATADAADPASIREGIRALRAVMGPVNVLHWNAYGGTDAGDILTAPDAAVHGIFDVAVFGLLAAVDEALPDLKAAGDGAILITNGAFGEVSPEVDAYATSINVMGLALGNAAKNKLAGLLSQRLKNDGVYVGEVMIAGTVKAKPTDAGIEPSLVANTFWQLLRSRGEVRARVT